MATDTSPVVVNPLLPECLEGHLTLDDFNGEDAVEFRPDDFSYYKGVLTSIVPGIVLGCLAAIAMIGVIIWTSVSFCRCCCTTRRKRTDRLPEDTIEDQFITADRTKENAYQVDAHFGLPKTLTWSEKYKVEKILNWSIVLFMLATVGVASWGIYSSIDHTNGVVGEFWNVFDLVENVAISVSNILTQLTGLIDEVEPALETVMKNEDLLLSAANNDQLLGLESLITNGLNELGNVKGILYDLKEPVRTAQEVANETFVQGLQGFRDSFESPTMAFQTTGRFIAIAVLFGMVILFSLVSAGFVVWGSYPRVGATAVIMLWLFVALLMFLGVGLLKGVNYVAEDGCLYTETFVVNYAGDYIGDPLAKKFALRAIEYYVNPIPPTEYVVGEAASKIVDPRAGDLLNLYETSGLEDLLLQLPTLTNLPVVSSVLSADLKSSLSSLASAAPEALDSIKEIDRIGSRTNIYDLYSAIKAYICCALSSDLSGLFDAWVATGCLSLVLATLCTWRLVWFVRKKYKYV
ncbi:hypothetical protein M9435_004722 [Picochlorum sp. BPE23]|nr:hypothetical protein M9435_004722 [Picochlorum sp. BPE23]